MDIVPVLGTIVLVSTLSTVILCGLSYIAFRARERRRSVHDLPGPSGKRFFVRYTLPEGGGASPTRTV